MELRATWRQKPKVVGRLRNYENHIYAARKLIPNQYEPFFRKRARYENSSSSTNIEGNPIMGQQALLILAEGSDPTKEAEVEKTNLDAAYEQVAQIAKDKSTTFDTGVIRSMHSMILRGLSGNAADQRGQYRVGGVAIQEARTKKVRYTAPSHLAVPELMQNFVRKVQEELEKGTHPVEVSALVHFGLISIHPFLDANGRTARLMADLVLRLRDADADGMVATSPIFFDRRFDYYNMLYKVQGETFLEDIDITDFVGFHVNAALAAGQQLEESAIALNKRLDEFKVGSRGALNDRQCLGLLYLFDLGRMSTMIYAKLVGTSRPTAANDLSDMLTRGLITRVGSGRNTKLELHPRFQPMAVSISEGSTAESTSAQHPDAVAV